MQFTLFFNMQLKSGRGRGSLAWPLENAHITLNMFQNRCPFLYNSSAFLLSFFCFAQLNRLDFVLSWNFISRTIFVFLWPDSILLYKRKMAMESRLFILFWIISFLLNKDKIYELSNSDILFSLKILSYEKLTKN